jgi:peptide/nickel transport system substrate-binding protein
MTAKVRIKLNEFFVLGLTIAILGLSVLTVLPVSAISGPDTLVLGVVNPPPTTFFQTATSNFIGNTLVDIPYYPINHLTFAGTLAPAIANIPQPIPGSNDTEWIVNLISPNLKWSDGVPLNASDLAFSYGLYLPTGPYANLSIVPRYGGIRGMIKSVQVVNSTAVEVTTYAPDPLFPYLTFLYSVYPLHYYKQFHGYNVLTNTPILSGPCDSAFCPVNYTAGSDVMNLIANPYSPAWNGTTPKIKNMQIDFFTTESALVNALASGTIDGALITPSDISALSSVPGLHIQQVASDYQMMIYMDSTGYPWNITAFRQALFYLVNKTEIDAALYNNTAPIGNPVLLIPQNIKTYWPGPSTPLYNYSPSMAVTLLKAAGLTQNSAGNWVMPNGTIVTINLQTPNSDPNYVRAAELVAASMESVGLKVNVEALPYSTVDTNWATLNFEMMIFPNNYASTPFRWMLNPHNIPGWTNTTFEKLFKEAISDTNYTQAVQLIKQAELVMANAAVINSIVITPQYVAYNTQYFTGWEPAISVGQAQDLFVNPIFSQSVLASVMPISQSSSASVSSSAISVSSPSSTTTTTTSTAIVGIVVAIIVIVAIAILLMRRR